MLDPLSVIGTAAAVGQIVGSIATAIANLTELRLQFSEAEITINLLVTELITIKAALKRIEHWLRSSRRPPQEDVATALGMSLDGCQTVVGALEQELEDILAGSQQTAASNFINFVTRARFMSNEGRLRAHHERFQGQVAALTFLLQVIQMTPSGQAASLREPKSRKMIQKVIDDASTLPRPASSIRSQWYASSPPSGLASPTTSLDHQLLNSRAYLNQGMQLSMPQRPRINLDHIHPITERPESEETSITVAPPPKSSGNEPDHRETTKSSERTPNAQSASERTSATLPSAPVQSSPKHLRIIIPNDPSSHVNPSERSAVSEPASALQKTRSILRTPVGYEGASRDESPQVQPRSADTLPSTNKLWNALKRKASRHPTFKSLRKQGSPTSAETPSPKYSTARPSLDFVDRFNSIKVSSPEESRSCPLVISAQIGLLQQVRSQLDQDADIEQSHPPSGRTALAVAAHCGHEDIVLYLLRHRAAVNGTDRDLQTPLHLAASRGHAQVVMLLLHQRANIEARDHEGKTPLRAACDGGHLEVAKILLEHRARANARDDNRATALHVASQTGNLDLVRILKEFGADVDAKDKSLMSAIHYAAELNHDDILQELIQRRNVDLRGKDSLTPLDYAASCGSTQTVKLLIKLGANPRSKSEDGMMALHWASLHGWPDVVDFLLQKRVAIDTKTSNGKTPLHLAVQSRNFSTAELLIRRQAHLEAFCKEDLRPLHYACKADDPDMIKLLLGSGARVQPPAKTEKHWPLQTAIASNSFCAVRILLEQGASPNDWDANRDRPLCLAARHGSLDVVHSLLEYGAKLDLRDGWDWTPLAYAAFYGNPDIVQLLIEKGARPCRDLDSSCGWESDPQGSIRMGFTMGHCIDEKRQESVRLLLDDARRPDVPAGFPINPAEMDSRPDGPEIIPNRHLVESSMTATVLSPPDPLHSAPAWEIHRQGWLIPEDLYEDPNHSPATSSAPRARPFIPQSLAQQVQWEAGPSNFVGPQSQANHFETYVPLPSDHTNSPARSGTPLASLNPSPISPSDDFEPIFCEMICDLCLLQGHQAPNLRDCRGCRAIFLHSSQGPGIQGRHHLTQGISGHSLHEPGMNVPLPQPAARVADAARKRVAAPIRDRKPDFIAELTADDVKELEAASLPRVELVGDLRPLGKAY